MKPTDFAGELGEWLRGDGTETDRDRSSRIRHCEESRRYSIYEKMKGCAQHKHGVDRL